MLLIVLLERRRPHLFADHRGLLLPLVMLGAYVPLVMSGGVEDFYSPCFRRDIIMFAANR